MVQTSHKNAGPDDLPSAESLTNAQEKQNTLQRKPKRGTLHEATEADGQACGIRVVGSVFCQGVDVKYELIFSGK